MGVKDLPLLERIIIYFASFIIAVYVLVRFRIWGGDFIKYFFMTERWVELIFVLSFTTAISMLFIWILRTEFRFFADVREKTKK
ncbi:MAG: hypothetical protein N3F05_04880 [Candidatus Diapherotrites archaeon]|nr:hypothetical protein [Candidatus Diapherotrites archaeon]